MSFPEYITLRVPEGVSQTLDNCVNEFTSIKNQVAPHLEEYAKKAAPYFHKIQPYVPLITGTLGALLFVRGVADLTRSKVSKTEALITAASGVVLFTDAVCRSFPINAKPLASSDW